MLAFEVTLRGTTDGTAVNWITTLLTILALIVISYRFACDLVFKIYEFLESNRRNTLETDLADPFSVLSLDALWFGARIARLITVVLKIHPKLLPSFLFEVFILIIHSPPLALGKVLIPQASGSIASYRIEAFLVSFMCLRVYVLAKMLRSHVANRYIGAKCVPSSCFSPAPRVSVFRQRHDVRLTLCCRYWLISKFSKNASAEKMNTWFTVKVLLHENAVLTLVLAFFILLVLTGDHPE